jgi:tape measure domain-containing protein
MSDVRLSISVDANQGRQALQQFKGDYTAMAEQLRKPLGKIAALRDLQAGLGDSARQLEATRSSLRDMAAELIAAEQPTKAQARAYEVAAQQAQALEDSIASQKNRLTELTASLRAAGVDTSRLGAEQKRLAAELAQVSAAADLQQSRVAGARAALGVRAHGDIQGEITALRSQYQVLKREGGLSMAELAQAKVQLRQRTAELVQETNGWRGALRQVGTETVVAFAGLAGATVTAKGALAALTANADAYQSMLGRLKQATASQEEFNRAQSELERIARAAGSPLAALATLYGRISRPLKETGAGQEQILQVTEAVALAFSVSGASAAEAEAGVIQFAQALGAGALRGDEFNSVAEQAPRLMQALAAGLGVPTTALRKMAEEGELTAAAVTEALTGQLDVIRAEAAALPGTVEAAMTRLRDAVSKAFGSADTSDLIAAIDELAAKLAEPEVVDGLLEIAEGLLELGRMAVEAATWLAGLDPALRNAALAAGALAVTAGPLVLLAGALINPLTLLLGHLGKLPGVSTAASKGLGAFGVSVDGLTPKLKNLADVAKLAKGALALGVVSWTAGNLSELYDLYQQHKQLTKAQREHKQSLEELSAKTAEYAGTVILPAASLARMNETERKAYAESLRLAEEHYRAQGEILAQQGDINGPVNPDAVAAYRRAREYREALQDIGDAETERENAEQRHKAAVERIKAEQLKAIQDSLGKEIQAYNAANLELNKAAEGAEAAMRRRVGVLEEFDRLIKDLGGGAEQADPSVGAAMALKAGARQALQAGDTEEAIRQARAAGEMLRELQQAGENTYGFKGMAEELKQIADAATQLDVDTAEKAKEAAQGQVDAIKARMDDLLAKAEAFKRINVEFNGFEQSAATLEQQAKDLAERLKKYMVIPVSYIGPEAGAAKQAAAANAQAGELIDPVKRATGGWIDGPGTPTSDSVLLAASRGEYVLNARAAALLGAANLDFMNRSGQLPVRDHLIPQIPALPSLERNGERQPLNLAMPWGGSYALEGPPAEVARLQDDLRRTARKFGRTRA